MRRLAILAAVALSACSTMPGVITPPAGYTHTALPFGAHEVVLPAADIEPFCNGLMGDGDRYTACYAGRTKTVFRPSCWSDPFLCVALKLHEYAHAWDWPANHPR